jgi:hypothetical protein
VISGGLRSSIWLRLLPALMLTACAGGPPASPQADQEGKRFDPPASEKGALYLYRPGYFGMVQPIDVGLVGGATTQLGPNNYIRLEGPPGPVEIDCKVGDRKASREVNIQHGQTRFVEVSMTMGWWAPGCEIAEVPPDQGQAAVRISQRLVPQ